jgi:hypothetical protein
MTNESEAPEQQTKSRISDHLVGEKEKAKDSVE